MTAFGTFRDGERLIGVLTVLCVLTACGPSYAEIVRTWCPRLADLWSPPPDCAEFLPPRVGLSGTGEGEGPAGTDVHSWGDPR